MKLIAFLLSLPLSTRLLLVAIILKSLVNSGLFILLMLAGTHLGASWWVTAIALATLIPGVLFAPALGWLVDRVDVKTAWIAALLVSGICVIGIALAPSPFIMVALVAIEALFSIVFGTAVFKLLPQAEGMDRDRANSFYVGIGLVIGISAPPLAALVSTIGTDFGFFLFGTLYIVSAIIIWRLSPTSSLKIEVDKTNWHEVWLGSKAIKHFKPIRLLIPVILGGAIATSIEAVAGVFWLQEVAGGAVGYALLLSAWTLGSLSGAAVAGRKWFKVSTRESLLLGGLLMALAILVEGAIPVAAIIGIAFLFGGFGNGVHNIAIRNLVYEQVPKEQQAQAWAVQGAAFSAAVAIGNVLGTPGLIAAEVSTTIIIAGGTGVVLVVGTYLAIALASLRILSHKSICDWLPKKLYKTQCDM